jgi:hypothetical protein
MHGLPNLKTVVVVLQKQEENLEKFDSTEESYRDLAKNKIDRDVADALYIQTHA